MNASTTNPPHPILLTQLQSLRGTKGIDCNETLLSKKQTSLSGHQLPTGPLLSHGTPASEAGCCLPSSCTGRQGMVLAVLCLAHSPCGPHCTSSSPPSNNVRKTPGKRRQFHVRNVTLEVLTASDHHRPCYTFHENNSSPGLTPVGVAVLAGQLYLLKLSRQFQFATVLFTSFQAAVECYSTLTSSCHLSPTRWLHGGGE